MSKDDSLGRCGWALGSDVMRRYHDLEWGVPLHDERQLFELLVLEGAQAGLSWNTVLNKREGYRAAFYRFEPEAVASMDANEIEAVLASSAIIRNRAKVRSVVENAKALLLVSGEAGSFSNYIWSFVSGRTVQNRWRSLHEVPSRSEISEAMSRDMRKRGFRFVGPTICYAFMQSAGLVNDHLVDCFRHRELAPRAR
jgi:DNA-3-methyladenine glycosylase I